ncbi:20488_t:CDS:1, partial [Cetraspora pellucida]
LIEDYPHQDGYENNQYLNIMVRAILIDKEFVNLYHEICDNFNDLIIQ